MVVVYILIVLSLCFGSRSSAAVVDSLAAAGLRDLHDNSCLSSRAPLFSTQGDKPIQITISANFDKVFDRSISAADSEKTQVEARIRVAVPGERFYDLNVSLRARGGARFEDCTFRPLKLKISEKEKSRIEEIVPAHMFAYLDREIKLTPLCFQTDQSRRALLKEYLIYRILGLTSTRTFSSALVQLTLYNEPDSKNLEAIEPLMIPQILTDKEWGFFIEPYSSLAERCNLNKESKYVRQRYHKESKSFKWYVLKDPKDLPKDPLLRKNFLKNPDHWSSYEQYPDGLSLIQLHFINRMIGNSDYNIDHRHNVKILTRPLNLSSTDIPQTKVRTYFVPYDFDISGAVDGGVLTFVKTPQEAAQDFLIWMKTSNVSESLPRTWLKTFVDRESEIMRLIANSPLDAKGKDDLIRWFEEHIAAIRTFLSMDL
jgi:hypothetical protein